MGLERLAAVLQGVHSNYEIDLFRQLIEAAGRLTGCEDRGHPSMKVIADHIRACAFLIADGVLPANDGRGYVLRRIIRRAIRHGYKLGCEQAFFAAMVGPLAEVMGEAYPELVEKKAQIIDALAREERRFGETLEQGMRLLEEEMPLIARLIRRYEKEFGGLSVGPVVLDMIPGLPRRKTVFASKNGKRTKVQFWQLISPNQFPSNLIQLIEDPSEVQVFVARSEELGEINRLVESNKLASPQIRFIVIAEDLPISGEVAFKLYDTYGFPLDLTRDIARERGLQVDEAGFESAMDKQRERARAAGKFTQNHLERLVLADSVEIDVQPGPTVFLGYKNAVVQDAIVRSILLDDSSTKVATAGDQCVLILDRTPFYAESGGQVGDTGRISWSGGQFQVKDTQKLAGKFHAHYGVVEAGQLRVGDRVHAEIDAERRADIVRHHSATHLMHAALRDILGEHVQQKGSLVAPDRLRFDFSHFEPVSPAQIEAIEQRVNAQIQANTQASAEEMDFDAAIEAGALAFFGDKYGDRVRVLRFGDYSTELCGGTHVARVGDIGAFKIIAETGISAGVRRIEAVAGRHAVAWMQHTERTLRDLSSQLKVGPEQLGERVGQVLERARALEKELDRLQQKLASARSADLGSEVREIQGVRVLAVKLDGVDPNSLRDTVDQLKSRLGSAVIVLGTAGEQGVRLVAGVTPDLTTRFKAGELVNHVATQVGGKGGGRPDFAQAGGSEPDKLDAAIESVFGWVEAKAG